MANVVMMAPVPNGATTVVNGRTYTAGAGQMIAAPDFDARVLETNGWQSVSIVLAGTTSQRPPSPIDGQDYFDQTLGINARYNAGRGVWLDVNGNAV